MEGRSFGDIEGQNNIIQRTPSGSDIIDSMLNGGYEPEIITTLYGPAGSGKTTICLQAIKSVVGIGNKAIYIDTEGGFSVERFLQLYENKDEGMEALKKISIARPPKFEDQKQAFLYLKEQMMPDVGILVVDSISMLYRTSLGESKTTPDVSRALSRQISLLIETAQRHKIPILITSQVYSMVDGTEKTRLYGGEFMRYASKCLIELGYDPERKERTLQLKKHRSIPEGEPIRIIIGMKGIEKNQSA
jgi:DNA repair protein RadB